MAVAEPARLETAYDAVDFVFNALPRDSESFACLLNVSARLPRDTLRRLQRRDVFGCEVARGGTRQQRTLEKSNGFVSKARWHFVLFLVASKMPR